MFITLSSLMGLRTLISKYSHSEINDVIFRYHFCSGEALSEQFSEYRPFLGMAWFVTPENEYVFTLLSLLKEWDCIQFKIRIYN